MIKTTYLAGCRSALQKFALSLPTQVDQFVSDIESGKDIPPEAAIPLASVQIPASMDGTTPMPQLPPFRAGATVAPELVGSPVAPPPMMNLAGE